MWPSLPTANHIADIANWFFIGSLVVGVVSTILIVWMAGVKEGYWEKDRAESAERVASLTVQGDQLRKDTAEANARALEARVELEKFRAPRTLSAEQQSRISEETKPFAGTKFDGAWSSLDGEIDFFFTSLEDALKRAGWEPISFNGQGMIYGRSGRASVGMANAFGTVIAVNFEKNPKLVPAALALLKCLAEANVAAVLQQNVGFTSTNPDTIHILIGTKH